MTAQSCYSVRQPPEVDALAARSDAGSCANMHMANLGVRRPGARIFYEIRSIDFGARGDAQWGCSRRQGLRPSFFDASFQ